MNYRKQKIKTIVEQVLLEIGIPTTVAANVGTTVIKNQVDSNNQRLDMPFNLPTFPNEADIQKLSPSEQKRYEEKKLRDDAAQYIKIQQTMNPPFERDRERMGARVNDPNSIYGRHPSLLRTSDGFYPNEKGILDYPGDAISAEIEKELQMREKHRAYEMEMNRNNRLRGLGIVPPERVHPHPDEGLEAMHPKKEKDTI